MAFKEDLPSFLNTDEFAETALINGTPVLGILDREFSQELGVEGYRPIFSCETAKVESVKTGFILTVASTKFKIVQKADDGTGMTNLILERQ